MSRRQNSLKPFLNPKNSPVGPQKVNKSETPIGAKDKRILLDNLDHFKNPSITLKLYVEYTKADVDLNSNRLLQKLLLYIRIF